MQATWTGPEQVSPEQLSPELVLVDPELARREREVLARLHDRPVARRPEFPPPAAEPKPAPSSRRSGARGLRLRIVVVGVLLCAGVALVGSRIDAGGSGRTSATAVPPAPSRRTTSGTRTIAARIRWRPIAGTKRYDVVLWQHGHRVADLWPTTSSIEVARSARLVAGAYQWFVFPDFGSRARPRYGPLVTHGTFVIPSG